MYTDDAISEIVSSWNLKYRRFRSDLDIAGSPERTLYRAVIQDENDRLWLLEALFPDSNEHKLLISKTLAYLRGEGI